jgi:hypothetical protein
VQELGSELEEGNEKDEDALPPPQPDKAKSGRQKTAKRKKSCQAIEEIASKIESCLLGCIGWCLL